MMERVNEIFEDDGELYYDSGRAKTTCSDVGKPGNEGQRRFNGNSNREGYIPYPSMLLQLLRR